MMRDVDDQDGNVTALHPKRTMSFVAKAKKGKDKQKSEGDLLKRIQLERENTKYWARILLLFPLAPVLFAMTTVAFGGVIINVANNQCNSRLLPFLQGAVVLSNLYILFYSALWLGDLRIRSLRLLRVIYFLFGLLCFVWWGIFGTSQAATATSTGFQSCLSRSPAIYIMAHYEVVGFWILFFIFIGFVINEKTQKARMEALQKLRNRRLEEAKQKERVEADKRERLLREAQERAQREEEAQREQLAAEQKKLFEDHEEEETKEQEPTPKAQEPPPQPQQPQQLQDDEEDEEMVL